MGFPQKLGWRDSKTHVTHRRMRAVGKVPVGGLQPGPSEFAVTRQELAGEILDLALVGLGD